MTEDPANRRIHGGGSRRYTISLIPPYRPTVTQAMHAEFTPVTAERPAAPGKH